MTVPSHTGLTTGEVPGLRQPAAALGYAACCNPDNPSTPKHPISTFSSHPHTGLTAGCPGQSGSRLHAVQGGFALVVTLALMVLLAILAVGLLSLSTVSLRTSGRQQAESEARANARMAMMLAIGELQKSIGPDQRITAPSAILDTDPESTAVDGVAHTHLTGVWNARDAASETLDSYNTNPPNYSRDKPNFRRWLVSNAKPEEVEQFNFAKDGALVNPTVLHGLKNPGQQVRAGKVPVKGGSYAWWWAMKIPRRKSTAAIS